MATMGPISFKTLGRRDVRHDRSCEQRRGLDVDVRQYTVLVKTFSWR